MPVNKYAAIRHKIIDKLIGNKYKRFPSKSTLVDACEEALYGQGGGNISGSTIEKDFQYMKLEYDAPIKFSRKNDGYYYNNPDFSINLNSSQIEAIKMAATILEQFKGTEIFKDFDSAIDKILDRVNVSQTFNSEQADKFIQFEKAPIVLGTEYLDPILQAIKQLHTVQFIYQSFKKGPKKERYFNPYVLKEYRNRWYVTGFDNDKKQVITYALDRIKELNVTLRAFELDNSFNSEKYFAHTIGITTSENQPEKIILSLSPIEGKYLKSQPLHNSQKVTTDNDTECIIELNVVITYELITQILALGQGVKVISPKTLVDQIKTTLQNAIDKY
jgi:predicted DNA-binding transcriptional regulator YafY